MDNDVITYYTLDQAREILREESRQKRLARQKIAEEKKERFLKAFEEHKEELKKDWADSRPQVPLNAQKEVTHQEQPQNNKNHNH